MVLDIGSKTSIHNLEHWVRILNANSFINEHPIDGKRLPEYQQAIDALIKYRDILINKINELYEQKNKITSIYISKKV